MPHVNENENYDPYPYVNRDNVTVWACCFSVIGPICQHRMGTRWENQRPSALPRND